MALVSEAARVGVSLVPLSVMVRVWLSVAAEASVTVSVKLVVSVVLRPSIAVSLGTKVYAPLVLLRWSVP